MAEQPTISGLIANVGEVRLTHARLRRLGDAKCEFVQLALWTASDAPDTGTQDLTDSFMADGGTASLDPAKQAEHPIYYGFNGRLFAQLFPGQTTGLIPVSNLNQICAKTGNGETLILRYVYYTKP